MHSSAQVDQSRWRDGGLKISYLWLSLLALPIIAVMAFAIFQPIQVLPRISLAPGFAFTDQYGDRLTNEDLRGKFVFYTFTHTNCGADCPDPARAMREMQELVAGLDTGGLPIEFVTISFDPAHDTPERLQAYAAELDADLSNWHFVTGDPTRLKNVIGGGFSTYYEEMEDGTFKFDPAFVLVDGWGIIRAKYKTASPDPTIIERDIGLLASELNNSEGVNRFAYEAAHLFLCYPS